MKYLILPLISLVFAAPACARGATEDILVDNGVSRDTAITVVATGSKLSINQTGQSITVIGADEISSLQGPDLTRVLERAPGVTITRNGGPGGFTGVRVRGAEAEQLLVLIDGVRVADVASPSGGFDFGNLLAGSIGKIELLRGSNSVVWGSQAIGGVLALTSREINGLQASAEYGSHNSLDTSAVAGLSGSRGALTLNAGYARTDGISAAAVGTEPDGYRQWHLGGRGRVELGSSLTATLTARYANSRLQIDGFPAPTYTFADTPEYQITREASGRAGLDYHGGSLTLGGGLAVSDTRRAYFDPTFGTAANYEIAGRSTRADLTGRLEILSGLGLNFGADSEWSRFSSSFDPLHKARLSSGHTLLTYHNDAFDLAGGLRVDNHSQFGTHTTFGANGSVRLTEGLRLRASYGEGFKAPTLYQLLSDYGNRTLRPETSRSFDAALEYGDRNGTLHFAATAFRRDSRDLIAFVSCFGVVGGICTARPYGTYNNIDRARATGFELEGDVRPTDRFTGHAAYSYVEATNRATGKTLARRPRHALTLGSDWRSPLHDLTLGADLRLVSDSFDDAGNRTRLDGYALITLRASLPLTGGIEIYGRIENVADVKYRTAAGYGTMGRTGYAGVRARF